MFRFAFALGLLAVSVMGQPPPPPNRPTPQQQPQQPPERPERPEMEDKEEKCPPVTGMEFICRVEHWDHEKDRLIKSMDYIECDPMSACYIGPLESRPAVGPWIRKYACGPKPCRWSGTTEDGEFIDEMNPCEKGTCGPTDFTIMMNGTRFTAQFCNMTEEDKEDEEDMEDMMEPEYAKAVCKVQSSGNDPQMLHECENEETCGDYAAAPWFNGTQMQVFICTKTPRMIQENYESKIEEMYSKMHYHLMDIGRELVKNGHIFYKGPHKAISHVWKEMSKLKYFLKFAEKKAREEKSDEMEIPGYVKEMYDGAYVAGLVLHNQVVDAIGGYSGNKIMEPIRRDMEMLSDKINGETDMEKLITYVSENLDWLLMHVEGGDLHSDLAKAAYRSAKELMLYSYEGLKMMDGDHKEVLAAMEDMGMDMQAMWLVMSQGPVGEGDNARSVAQRLRMGFRRIGLEMQKATPAKKRLEQIWMSLEKLQKFAKERRMMSKEAMDTFMKMANMKLRPMADFIKSLPNSDRIMPILKNFMTYKNYLWNHMTGGMTPEGSSSVNAIQRIMEFAKQLAPLVEEGEMMQRGMRAPPPAPAPGPGQGPRQDQGQGQRQDQYTKGAEMDMLRGLRDRLEDLDRRARDQDRGDRGDMGSMGGEIRGQLDAVRRDVADMMMTMASKAYDMKGQTCDNQDRGMMDMMDGMMDRMGDMMGDDRRMGDMGGDMGGNRGGNMGGNMGGDMGGNRGGNMGGNMPGDMNMGGDMGRNMGGDMGGNMNMGDMDMEDDDDHKCPEPLYWKMIGKEDRDRWHYAEGAFISIYNEN